MTASTNRTGMIVPILRYRDIAAAMEWLCQAFGFEKHMVVRGDGGEIRYAQLAFGDGLVMLGMAEQGLPDGDTAMLQPAFAGNGGVQTPYVFVGNIAAHYRRAKAAGAPIVLDLDDEDSEGGYSCQDPEGHIWNFGTYDPWGDYAEHSASDGIARPRPRRRTRRRLAIMACLLLITAGSFAAFGWADGRTEAAVRDLLSRATQFVAPEVAEQAPLAKDRSRQVAWRQMLAREMPRDRISGIAAQPGPDGVASRALEPGEPELQAAADLAAAKERERKLAAERAEHASRAAEAARVAQEAKERLAAERSARQAAERAAREAQERLAAERKAKEAAERAIKETREQVERDRKAEEAAERASEAAERASRAARYRETRARVARQIEARARAESNPSRHIW